MQQEKLQELIETHLLHLSVNGDVESKQTIDWHRRRLRRFVRFVGRNDLDPLKADTFVLYASSLRQGRQDGRPGNISVYTRRGYIQVLRQFGRWLRKQGHTQDDLYESIKPPKLPRRPKPKFITMEGMAKMIAATEKPRDRAILLFLRDTGCRTSEVLGLKWCDLDLDNQSALVTGKGNKARTVFFTQETHDALHDYRETVPNAWTDWMWWGQKNGQKMRPLRYKGLRSMMLRLAEKAEVVGRWNAHAWRHAYGRYMTRSRCPTRVLQDLMGHASIEVTMIYSYLDDCDLREAYFEYNPYEEEDEEVAHAAV